MLIGAGWYDLGGRTMRRGYAFTNYGRVAQAVAQAVAQVVPPVGPPAVLAAANPLRYFPGGIWRPDRLS